LQEFLRALGLRAEGERELVLSREEFMGGGFELPHRVAETTEVA
jgi:hypothetical protein